MTADYLTIRRATSADEKAIGDLSFAARRVALHVPWTDLRRELRSTTPRSDRLAHVATDKHRIYDLYVCESNGKLGCLWTSIIEPASVSQLRAFVLADDWSLRCTLDALLPSVKRSLRAVGVTTLAFIGVDRWLLDGLAASGFAQANTVVTLHKDGWDIPSSGNRQAIVRPVTSPDFSRILDIDAQAFVPLWRNTPLTLAEFRQTCPYFRVAELEQRVVGYAYANMIGHHGHLTRLAVHPQHQGRQIGVRLLADVIQFFRQRQTFGVTLNTQQDNLRARRLYTWFGFVLLGQEAEVWTLTP